MFFIGTNSEIMDLIEVDRTPRTGDLPCRKAATYTGQHREEIRTGTHASSGIRIHDPSVWADEDITCFRPHGHTPNSKK
jgi:hypothetical protein